MMKLSEKNITLKELKQIPGVGDAIAEDLWEMGIRGIDDLKNKKAEALYMQLCAHQGKQVDRCMLYVFRCAVYFASCQSHQPHLWLSIGIESGGSGAKPLNRIGGASKTHRRLRRGNLRFPRKLCLKWWNWKDQN